MKVALVKGQRKERRAEYWRRPHKIQFDRGKMVIKEHVEKFQAKVHMVKVEVDKGLDFAGQRRELLSKLVEAAVECFPVEPKVVALKPWTSDLGLDWVATIKQAREKYSEARANFELGVVGFGQQQIDEAREKLGEFRKRQRKPQGHDYQR